MLSLSPKRLPVHETYVPVLYELTALRLFAPYWPSAEHYCAFPGAARGRVLVRTRSLEYPDLLAHQLAYTCEVGTLLATWRLSVAPHLAGSDATTFVIEPTDPVDDRAIAHDLLQLGETLAFSIRRLARTRLVALGPAETRAHDDPSRDVPQLSTREAEVFELFLSGFGVAALAQRLFISPYTVRNHLKHVCAKLGVSSQRELRELFAELDE